MMKAIIVFGFLLSTVVSALSQGGYHFDSIKLCQDTNIFRNPFCCGKLFIPAYKNEESMLINGIHEPLASEELFDDVQDILNGRKRKALNHKNGFH